jgi:DNA polymerase III delta subunit
MNINELKKRIKYNNVPNFMIWVGPETYVKQVYKNKISKNWAYLDSIDSINLNRSSLFKNIKSYYYIDGEALNKISEKEFKEKDLRTKLLNSTNCLIFDFKSLSSNDEEIKKNGGPSKFILGEFQDYIVSFHKLSERLLLKYFGKCELSEDRLKNLFVWNNNDYIKIQLEIDKILNYTKAENSSPNIAFDILLKEGVIYKPVGDVIFDFSNALLSGDINLTNYWYKQLRLSEEPVLSVTSLLYKNFKEMYYVKAGDKDPKIIENLKYSSGRLWHLRQKTKAYSINELERNIQVVQFVENGIKTGQLEEKYAMDYLVINLLG